MALSFNLPIELLALIDAGVWPNKENQLRQNLTPISPAEAIRRIASDEDNLYLNPPPFHAVAVYAEGNSFWADHAAPDQLDFNNALVLGDFGLGSDAPIVLDYSENFDNPSIKRLQWHSEGNRWILACKTFAEFAAMLELTLP